MSSHPHCVAIPDPQTEGVRAYREPEVAHALQVLFLEESEERRWIEQMRALLSAGRSAEAATQLAADLAPFDGRIARLAKSATEDNVALDGWDDLLPILAEWEGPAITAITVGLTNPADLVFEAQEALEPELLLGLYSDEVFSFGSATEAEIIAECAKDCAAWAGAEEDVEFYCGISGLAELNTALVHCKHRYFLRDGRDGVEGRAPGGYVEFILGSWLLATRFLQAAQRMVAAGGLPAGCRLIIGTVDMNADFVAVLGAGRRLKPRRSEAVAEPNFATLTIKPWVPRQDPTAQAPATGSAIRQRIGPVDDAPAATPARSGFLARLIGRLGRK